MPIDPLPDDGGAEALSRAGPIRGLPISTITYGLALTLMIGWLLWIGRPVLVPVIAALISVYILSAAAEGMGRIPALGRLPGWVRRTIVLLAFAIGLVLLFALIFNNLAAVATALPRYETNLDTLVTRMAALLGIEGEQNWLALRRATIDQIELRALITPTLLSLQGFGSLLFLVVLYSAFFMTERGVLARKLMIAAGGGEQAEWLLGLTARINDRIGRYLFVKTAINAILAGISYVIMLVLGIEFALFWAVLIGFLNYIPYIGSLVGVIFPLLLSLAQFGTLWMAGVVAVTLSAAQIFVGAVLEPRMMGRAFNLSPLIVLLALAVWSSLWGIAGAVLAVPMTASLVIVLAEIQATRPVAVMLSASGRV